jgi:hypothetical protein
MFLEIPVIFYYDNNETEQDDIDINPLHIVSIKADPDEPLFCIVADIAGDCWNVRMSRQQLKSKIKHHIETNIFHRYYNNLRKGNQ